jgi:hypothetical protein
VSVTDDAIPVERDAIVVVRSHEWDPLCQSAAYEYRSEKMRDGVKGKIKAIGTADRGKPVCTWGYAGPPGIPFGRTEPDFHCRSTG